MSTNEDLFANDSSLEIDPSKNYLEELVGDDKKFKTPEELARGKAESDAFIEQLKQEQNQLRQELRTRLNLEQFLDQLKTAVPPRNNDDSQDHGQSQQDKSVMSAEELAALVRSQVQNMKVQETAQSNLSTFNSKFASAHGPNAAAKLRSQASELGMTTEEVKALAARNPNAALKMLGVGEQRPQEGFNTPPRTSFTLPPQGQKRGMSYFEEIRKRDINEYFSPKVQNELFAARQEMGADKFYNS